MRQGLTYAMEDNEEPLELHIYTGCDGTFTYYDDAGDDYTYEDGAYERVKISWSDKDAALSIGQRQGSYAGMKKERSIRIFVDGEYRTDIVYRGEETTIVL